MPDYALSRDDDAQPADDKAVEDGLDEFSRSYLDETHQALKLFVRDEEGRIVGGLLGEIYDAWLHVRILWLHEQLRGLGYGRKLMEAAHEAGRQHGIGVSHLSTLDFEARPFYEHLGYEVIATRPYGNGHQRFYI